MADRPRLTARRDFVRATAAGAAALWLGVKISTAGRLLKAARAEAIPGLDDYCERALADWKVPGLALAVVRGGQLRVARGYGVREFGKSSPVDENTVFPIASCTKSFTAAVLARLVDDGRLQWDDPIGKHVPALRLPPDFPGGGPSIRQVLQHRSGLPTANMLWRSGQFNAEEILHRVRFLKPFAKPGEKFLYNNVMYVAAGKAAEHITGRTWSELVTTKLFDPLGMRSSLPDSAKVSRLDNVAAPHAENDGEVSIIERDCSDVIAPAGAIHSTARDMAQWLSLQLNQGRFGGRQLLSAVRVAEMHTPVKPDEPPAKGTPKAPMDRYGLGWFINRHAGRTVVEHSGTMNGSVAWTALIREEQSGIVILSNSHRTGINSALRSWIFDRLLGQPDYDWSRAVLRDYTQGWQRLLREAKAEFDAKSPPRRPLSLPFEKYVGSYRNPLYGTITISETDGHLALRFGTRFRGTLKAWQGDEFRVFFPNPQLDDWLVRFSIADRKVVSLRVQEAPWTPQSFDDRDDLGVFDRH